MTIIVRSNEPAAKAPEAQASEAKPQEQTIATLSAPEENPSEQNESLESEPKEAEALDGEESESEGDPDSKDEQDSKDAEKDKPKKKSGFQRRIDKLNQRVSAKEQEAEYWKQQALKSANESSAEPKVEPKKQDASEGKPKPDNFDTHGEYVEALTEWKTDQKLKERDQKHERSKLEEAQAKLVSTYSERMKSFSEKVEDFQDVLEEVNDIPLSPTLRDIILSSQNGPELAYEMAKNRDEYARLCKLPPTEAAREVGKLEARLSLKASDPTTESKKVTNAPKPLSPVKAGSAPVKKSLSDPTLSQREYEQLRMEQIKKRRQA